ncbi:ATP:cob(I)alamin adenosyltransferase [Endozoicomonas sp. (ex Bugula neritina AB1)]|nr:ATP:cob(I)alamin adenosyltransferase [Endozoicomonas sp. (ex Bugula neritina AB1)]
MSERKGYRLTRIYTRTGDKGKTRIGNGEQLSKNHPRIDAIGTVDELNSCMGMMIYTLGQSGYLTEVQFDAVKDIQHRLFDVGGELAMPGHQLVTDEHAVVLEQLIDELNEPLPPLKNFTLPGGGYVACHTHMARTVARRAERTIIALQSSGETVNAALLSYVNRLSDLLYVLGRHCARKDEGEVLWKASPKKKFNP